MTTPQCPLPITCGGQIRVREGGWMNYERDDTSVETWEEEQEL